MKKLKIDFESDDNLGLIVFLCALVIIAIITAILVAVIFI